MPNHYGPFDCYILLKIINNTSYSNFLYIIAKSNLFGNKSDQNIITYYLYYIQSLFMNAMHLIPYDRGNIESGKIVKNEIINKLQIKNTNVCIFPEGTGHRDGIPKQFKNGIFHLASENNLTILPITIIYEKNIGSERGEPINLLNWFDNVCHVYIHEKINNSNWKELKEKTFNTIKEPLLNR